MISAGVQRQMAARPCRSTSTFKPFTASPTHHAVRTTRIASSRSNSSTSSGNIAARTAQQPAGVVAPEHTLSQRLLTAALAASVLLGSSSISSGPAAAIGPVSVKLEELQVSKTDCGAGISTVGGVTFSGSTQKATCLSVAAQASNPSNKPLYNADVFGRIYDVNGEAAIDDTENIRIAYIDEIPPGKSSVSFRLNVPLEQFNLGPLKLTGFKATGFPGKMLPKTAGGSLLDAQSQSDCEITGDCDDIELAAAIR